MARGVNKVILIGNLGIDPETRYTASGTAVTNVRIATSDMWKDKQTGEMQERTEWHNLVFFGRLAEITSEYLRKGSKIYVEGRLQTRKWQDKDGNDKYSTEVVANEMQMLDAKGGGTASFDQPRGGGQQRPQQQAQPAPAGQDGGGEDDLDDDIPF